MITDKFYKDLEKVLIAESEVVYPTLEEVTDFLKRSGVLKVRAARSWPQKKRGYREVLIEGWVPFLDSKAKSADLVKQANSWLAENLKKYRDSGFIHTPSDKGWYYSKGDSHFELSIVFKLAFPKEF